MWRRRRCSSSHSRLRGEKHPWPKMVSQHLQMDSSVWLSGKKSTFAVVSFCPPSRSKTKPINNCNICATLQRHLLHTNMALIFSLSDEFTVATLHTRAILDTGMLPWSSSTAFSLKNRNTLPSSPLLLFLLASMRLMEIMVGSGSNHLQYEIK